MNPSHLARWGTILAVLLISACGGGGSAGGEAVPVARVEITPAGALLTGAGQSRQLVARAYDADGNPVDATFTWTSGRTSSVSVDGSGVITAQTAIGSAQIVAATGGVKSRPVLVLVAQPVAGATLVSDEQMEGDPVESRPGAAPSPTNTYRVTLQGVAAPALGGVLIGSGGKPVAGRVVAVQSVGTQTIVTLQPLAPNQQFTNFRVQESFDLSQAQVRIPAEVAARFEVRREGNRFAFTERPGARARARAQSAPRMRALAASGTFALPPFSACESNFPNLDDVDLPNFVPISLDGPLSFAVTIAPGYELDYDSATGLNKLLLNAEPTLEMEAGFALALAVEATYGCKITLFEFVIPFSGPLGWIASGVVPVGVGFDVGGKITAASANIAGKVEAKGQLALGFDCTGGACGVVASAGNGTLKTEPTLQLPNFGTDPRFEPSLALYAFTKINLGNPIFQSLQFEALEAKVSAQLEGSFALWSTQVNATDYSANYGAALGLQAGAGVSLGGALELLGLGNLAAVEFNKSIPLAASPTGTVSADRATFVAGDVVNFKVQIEPAASANFFPTLGPYNIERVMLARKTPGGVIQVDSVLAAPGQTSFDLSHIATDSSKVDEFHAFVRTKLLPAELFSIEIGQAIGVDADLGVRLLRTSMGEDGLCDMTVLSEVVANPADYLYAEDEQRQVPFACNASIAGANASSIGSGSVSGTSYSASTADDPGLPVTEISAQGQSAAQATLAAQSSQTRRNLAMTFVRAEAGGSWTVVGGSQPVVYTLTAQLAAQPGAGAAVQVADLDAPPGPFGTQFLVRTAICPELELTPAPDDWVNELEGHCFGATNQQNAIVSFSGVLAPGQRLGIDATSAAAWSGLREVSPALTQGPQGSRQANASFSFTLTFAPP